MSNITQVSQTRASTNESPSLDYPHIAAGDLTVPGAEWPNGLVPSVESAVLRSDPDGSPDPLSSPEAKKAEDHVNDVVVLDDEKGASFARSPFSHWYSVDN